MKRILVLLVAVSAVFLLGSCSLVGIGSPTKTSGTISSSYPDSVVYRIKLPNETYLCSSFNVNNTDAEISLRLIDVYSVSSDGKITWIGKDKQVPVVAMEKIIR